MLQAGRSLVRVPDEVNFLNWPNNPSSRTMALRSTQLLTKMSIRYLPGGKKRPARRAGNLVAICEPNDWKCGSLNLSQSLRASTVCIGITLPYWCWGVASKTKTLEIKNGQEVKSERENGLILWRFGKNGNTRLIYMESVCSFTKVFTDI
jgi:hypothetical protein